MGILTIILLAFYAIIFSLRLLERSCCNDELIAAKSFKTQRLNKKSTNIWWIIFF
jgi:hypothetical protein